MSGPPPLPSESSSDAPPPLPSDSTSDSSTSKGIGPAFARTVIISSISTEVQDEHLKELFECCGPILSVTQTQRFAERAVEIEYEQEAHAKGAITLSGTPLGDRPLLVEMKPDPNAAPLPNPFASTLPNLALMNMMPVPGMMAGMMFPQVAAGGLPPALLMANQARADEVSRTVYVGNVNLSCDEITLGKFMASAGNVMHVKFANEIPGTGARFAFVEFDSVQAVEKAMTMSGSILLDRAIKVGQANNPIFKPTSTPSPAPQVTPEVLQRIREAQQKLANNAAVVAAGQAAALQMVAAQGPPQITLAVEKKEKESKDKDGDKKETDKEKDDKDKKDEKDKKKKKHRSRSRSRSRGRKHSSSRKHRSRSRSRSRGRHRRSRSRSPRDPRDHRRHRSRSRDRNYVSRSDRAANKLENNKPKEDPHKGLFFNGYRWQKIEEVIQTTASAGVPPQLIHTLNIPALANVAQAHAHATAQILKAQAMQDQQPQP